MAPALGEPVADLAFVTPLGEPTSLHRFLGKPLLLVFLRHLA